MKIIDNLRKILRILNVQLEKRNNFRVHLPMSAIAKVWQPNLVLLVSAFWTIKLLRAEFNYDHI